MGSASKQTSHPRPPPLRINFPPLDEPLGRSALIKLSSDIKASPSGYLPLDVAPCQRCLRRGAREMIQQIRSGTTQNRGVVRIAIHFCRYQPVGPGVETREEKAKRRVSAHFR